MTLRPTAIASTVSQSGNDAPTTPLIDQPSGRPREYTHGPRGYGSISSSPCRRAPSPLQSMEVKQDYSVASDAALSTGDDDVRLAELGYKPVYARSMSRWAILGLAFSVLSCWGEIGSSLTSGLNAGGPAGLVWGWIGVSACTIPVVWSLAEICSYHPVSGGQYYWVANLAGPRYARGLSYITAWAQLAGLVGLGSAAAANVGESTFGMIALAIDDFEEQPWMLVVEALGIITLCAIFNFFGRRLLNGTGLLALVFGVGGLCVTVIVLLSMANEFQSGNFVFTQYANATGLSDRFSGVVVCLGITNASYVLVAYDEPAHHTEEMPNPQQDAPKAMVWSVYLGCITGLIYLLTLMFVLDDLDELLEADNPIMPIYMQATGSLAVSCVLGTILLLTQVLAEISFIAETSRSLMAFARDGGVPFHGWLCHMHPTLNVPVRAIACSAILQGIVMMIYFGSSTAFLTILALGTVGSYVSYAIPIAAKLVSRRDGHVRGPFAMGSRLGFAANIVALLYLTFAIIFFYVPTRYPVTAGNMNYMIVATGIVALLAALCWTAGRARFTFLPRQGSAAVVEESK